MKKFFIIIIIIFVINLSGCKNVDYVELYKNVDYVELYKNNEIIINDEIEKSAIEGKAKLAIENLNSQNIVEIHTSTENDNSCLKTILKYNKEKEELIYESTFTKNNEVINEEKVYVVNGYMYKYTKSIKPFNEGIKEEKYKYKLDFENGLEQYFFENILELYFIVINYEIIFNDHPLQFGNYEYGTDNYGNIVFKYNQEQELPVFINYCNLLVIECDLPIFYVYQRSSSVEVCELMYENIKIKFPDLEGYELIEEK